MKRTKKGFTLVELLIVIAVIGILSTMAVIGGSEANNIATANKIVEEFKIISAAMNMYYADNRTTCDAAEANTLAATIKTGLAPYLKMDVSATATNSPITAAATGDVGKYNIMVTDAKQWWLSYTLPEADSKVASILANKAATEGFKKATTGDDGTTYDDAYEASEATIYMRVR